MLDMLWVGVIIGVLGCIWLYWKWKKQSKLPPGPKGWPLVGNAFQQNPGHPYITWSKWADEFGEVYTMTNFGTPVVVCSSSNSIWEMLVTKSSDFAGRPDLYPTTYMTFGAVDLGSGDFGSHWAYRKKVFITSAKMYGDGLDRLETIMLDVISELVNDFQEANQHPFDPMKPIQLALCNTLALLLLGDSFEKTDPDFLQLLENVELCDDIITPTVEFLLLASFPWLHNLPLPFCQKLDRFMDGFMKDWLPRMIKKRKAQCDVRNPQCILDAFLKQHELDMKNKPEHVLEMKHIITLCENMFLAGMLTSTSAMYSTLAILTVTPDIQSKVQAEIKTALGERRPSLKDKESMPYTQAVLEEVMRYTVVVNGLPHKSMVDSYICGHFIPKGTQMWANVWHLGHNPEIYEDPWKFKPERFLDDSGEFLPPDHPVRKNVLIFGAGRRLCPGEQLARNRIFLITVSLLQNFMFKPAEGYDPPQSDPCTFAPGIGIKPNPFMFRAIPRDSSDKQA